jgi:hypothetical protein
LSRGPPRSFDELIARDERVLLHAVTEAQREARPLAFSRDALPDAFSRRACTVNTVDFE